jgi:hypothetical protein
VTGARLKFNLDVFEEVDAGAKFGFIRTLLLILDDDEGFGRISLGFF